MVLKTFLAFVDLKFENTLGKSLLNILVVKDVLECFVVKQNRIFIF